MYSYSMAVKEFVFKIEAQKATRKKIISKCFYPACILAQMFVGSPQQQVPCLDVGFKDLSRTQVKRVS